MHPDTHLRLHHQRAADLHARAAAYAPVPRPAPQRALRTRLGWVMVEVGLRLAQHPPARPARIA
ncbi:hypothetical protein AR457_21680 [Streptomyces agglomeratus]|uniref:Uncharacterized protein n=1 Tax=Streptomyces agglomeratus TaxID=285458 RepID=A0A1E5PAW5_9ACTN|nr:hypothetical protein [Streptomyces agglomeratus]OEJ26672.1 hypothetical protein AS594_21440 [Streptomyces agglomeratus]OEJ39260.1 hypothetical protein BGK70_14975 [Streptomyces agglomeratus]OEJ46357.1 hypothetical protein AR457_21680 [Streptomyces agglomeratus]OEJ51781.1 hypothetical protein BGK72_14415 [Streptomyces agglomeratus]OEJ59186.1 hypothetical protein BGM19_15525 [Streptomyces agglomeratus]